MKRTDVLQTLKNASGGYFKFLYLSPERIETSLFLEYLPALHVNLIAVDEAHCISQWGYDFRPSFLRIASLRNELPGVPDGGHSGPVGPVWSPRDASTTRAPLTKRGSLKRRRL